MLRGVIGIVGCCLSVFILEPDALATSIKSLGELNAQQAVALEDSQQRLLLFDRELQVVESQRMRRQINRQEFERKQSELVNVIADEAEFQNALLTKQKPNFELLSEKECEALKGFGEWFFTALPRIALAFIPR
jgi:hypothetical protein